MTRGVDHQRDVRPVARSFYVYAVLSNTMFQRGIFVLFFLDRGFSIAEVALLQMLLYLGSGLSEIPTGILADRFGRRLSNVVGQLLIAFSMAGHIVAEGFPAFVVLFGIQALGMAFVSGSDTSLLYDLLRSRGAESSYLGIRARYAMLGTWTLGAAIALGGPLQAISWTAVYLGATVPVATAALILAVGVPEIRARDVAALDRRTAGDADGAAPDEDGDAEPSPGLIMSFQRVLAIPGVALLVVVSGLMHATLTPYVIFAQALFTEQGISTIGTSLLMAAGFAVGGVFPLLATRAERVVGVRLLVLITLLGLAASLYVSVLALPLLTVAAFFIVVGVPETTAVVVDDLFQRAVPSGQRASVLSAITFVESALIGVGYLALGAMMDATSAGAGMAWYALVPVTAALLWMTVFRIGGWLPRDTVPGDSLDTAAGTEANRG